MLFFLEAWILVFILKSRAKMPGRQNSRPTNHIKLALQLPQQVYYEYENLLSNVNLSRGILLQANE